MKLRHLLITSFAFFFLTLANCGGSGGSPGDDDDDDNDDNNDTGDSINTEKLVGTPFEGLTTGDDFDWYHFQRDDYLTTTVDYVPIPVFLAFFTASQEETVEEGITIANNDAEFEVFEVIDEWQDDARVIYKVDEIADAESGFPNPLFAAGHASTWEDYYEGKTDAGTIVTDWIIELKVTSLDKWLVTHELGHAFGLPHALIDYANDTSLTEEPNNGLEENSIMQEDGNYGSSPALNDYNYMMRMQGELLLRHLGEEGDAS